MSIEDILKDMPLDDKVKAKVTETWDQALADAKLAQEGQVREELTKTFEDQMSKMQEAFGLFLEERITPHVADLKEGVDSADKLKSQLAAKITEVEATAKKAVAHRLRTMEASMKVVLEKELAELHEDVVATRRAALKSITEQKADAARKEQMFLAKGAKVLEHMVNVMVPRELDELKEDIQAAREDNFGREIFEAMATTFRTQFFNSSAEFKKLSEAKALAEAKEKETARKAAQAIREAKAKAAASDKTAARLQESIVRAKTMARLMKPLSGNARTQMGTLLEATKTKDLEAAYRKAVPTLVKETAPAPRRKAISESKTKTPVEVEFHGGGGKLLEEADDPFADEVAEIRRLAGNA